MNDVIIKKKSDLVISEEDVKAMEYISHGYNISDVSSKLKVNKRTMEARVNKLRHHFGCVTISQLACEFIRKGLIK